MRHRWIRAAGLGSVFLAAVVLAVSPVPAATAQTVMEGKAGSRTAFWDEQANWFDQTTLTALRATQQPDRWEVLVDLEKDGEWDHQGFLEEVYRRRPEPSSITPDETLRNTLDSFGTVILIGKVRSSKGSQLYVVAAVLEQDSSFQDSEGRILQRFVPLHVDKSYQSALRFAKTYDGSVDNGENLDTPQGVPAPPEKVLSCDERCANQQRANYRICDNNYTACLSDAYSIWLSCHIACVGNTVCQAACAAYYVYLRGSCVQSQLDCHDTADSLYDQCALGCLFGGGCKAATQTATAALSLEGAPAVGGKLATAPIDFGLARAEKREGESFILDEWAVVRDGRIRTSSNPAFAAAMTEQRAVPSQGSFLMIQEPVHEMNSRHVPKPEVRLLSTALASSERGAGEIVAARLEFSPTGVMDHVEIVYTSKPMDANRLEKLLDQRVGLEFATEKGHRTAVYVVFRLTHRFEILRTVTVFPKCCCGGVPCV